MNIFSDEHSTLRLVWDATTLDALMKDPLNYYWKYVLGYRSRSKSVDLLWGTGWERAIGLYHSERARGMQDHGVALRLAIEYAIEYAHQVELDVVAAESGHKANKKNLSTLIRSLIWFDDEYGDYHMYSPVFTEDAVVVEPLGIKAPCGTEYVMVGNYDQIVRDVDDGELMVLERKTTAATIGPRFWYDYDPSTQLNVYDWISNRHHSTTGVLIEACQTAVGFTRFDYHKVKRTKLQREHWLRVMEFWIRFAERLALDDDWENAMNLATQKYENVTRNMQRKSPALWNGMLQVEMEKRLVWNPLEID